MNIRKLSLVLVLTANVFPAPAMAFGGQDKREICANWFATTYEFTKNEKKLMLIVRS